MKNISFVFFCLCLLFIACKNDGASVEERIIGIPKLINRPDNLMNGKEWDNVQNQYAKLRDAILKKPKDSKAWVELAELFIQEARVTGEHHYYYPSTLMITNNVLGFNPNEKDIMFRCLAAKASVELSLHDFAGALETANKAIVINPYNAQIYGALVDANVELGNYPEAVVASDKMVSIRPDIRSYSRVSYLREIYGDPKGAMEAMKMAVEAGGPGQEATAWAMLNLGKLHYKYGKKKDAIVIYNIILEDRPNYPYAQEALAEIMIENGQLKEAKDLINKAIISIPDAYAYTQLAHIAKKENNKAEYERLTKEIITMMEADMKTGHKMELDFARVYADLLDNPAKALEYAKIEYARRPKNIDVNREMASIYSQLGQKEDANKYFTVACSTNSKNPELVNIKQKLSM
ncbi:MAG TPA: tetratricopeptide repeat protein [Saprospiraceae bacterium]|nr:tetratricopeptide repeat protein [Saprospiraceae bacterium]